MLRLFPIKLASIRHITPKTIKLSQMRVNQNWGKMIGRYLFATTSLYQKYMDSKDNKIGFRSINISLIDEEKKLLTYFAHPHIIEQNQSTQTVKFFIGEEAVCRLVFLEESSEDQVSIVISQMHSAWENRKIFNLTFKQMAKIIHIKPFSSTSITFKNQYEKESKRYQMTLKISDIEDKKCLELQLSDYELENENNKNWEILFKIQYEDSPLFIDKIRNHLFYTSGAAMMIELSNLEKKKTINEQKKIFDLYDSQLSLFFLDNSFSQIDNKIMQCSQAKELPNLENLIEPCFEKKTISLPLTFDFLPVELLSKQFTKLNNTHSYRIHYLGARPHNTITLHKKYAYSQKTQYETAYQSQERQPLQRYRVDTRKIVESYFVQERLRVNNFYKNNMFYRAFEGMNPTLNLQSQYIFNSIFEEGNLDCVIKIQEKQFDLFLRIDSNTKGHVQWFYFSVRNKQTGKIKMNLCNLSKAKSLYESGMQPYVFSKKKFKSKGEQWRQGGINLGLSRKELRYDYLDDKVSNFDYYCLEIEYNFEEQEDEVFFAYCVPYTFSRLQRDISTLDPVFTKQAILGKSLAGIEIPILHITNHSRQKQKKNVLITARFHPGQSNSSHTLLGFMQFITSNQKQAVELRNRINFFIIPMANPDGVILGNTRTSAAGKDLNRQFLNPSREMHPEVTLIKQFAKKLHSKFGVFMYLDFHGHSRKKNTFFYGPAYTISEPNYYKSRILPKLIQKINSNFRYHSCSFTIDEEKKKTARAIMFEHLKITFTFTIETSIGFYYNCEQLKTLQFKEEEWNLMGVWIAQGLENYVAAYEEFEEILKERRSLRQKKRPPTAGKCSFSRQDDEDIPYIRQTQPLKIVYKDKSLFSSMIQQIKIIKNNGYMKEIDDDCQSDAHDEQEDFDRSKMKEFNSLLNDMGSRVEKNKRKNDVERQKIRSEYLDQDDLMKEQKELFSELEAFQKPSTMHGEREKSPEKKSSVLEKSRNLTRSEPRRTSLYRTTMSNNNKRNQNSTKLADINRQKNVDKKIISQTELTASYNNKISYFGQYHIFFESQREEETVFNNFKKYSVSRKERTRQSRSHHDEKKIMSQTYFERNKHQPLLSDIGQKEYSGNIVSHPPKAAHFEFDFNGIESAIVTKEKLKDYLRNKASRSHRNNVIGPASFYGMRQNINNKISNKKKFFEDQFSSKEKKQQSIKVIKFT